jgi:Fe-S oxidoreductase
MTDEESVIRKLGVQLDAPDTGCCGMAGPFGFDNDKYVVAQKIGERSLLPAVRKATAETLIVADGFSCREQILQSTGRKAIHLAELLQVACTQS